jgi:protein-tyrosine phosphatase
MMKILFVCLGNICRSPMAEGVLRHLAEQRDLPWKIDSAGTEYYHVGERPDRRAIAQCRKFGIDISNQRARQIQAHDFEQFDLIYALADDVLHELHSLRPRGSNHSSLSLLMDVVYPGQNRSVPDPWYGDEEDFSIAYELIREACEAIISAHASPRKY